jgi:CRISPR-associated protein Cas2
VLKGKSLKPTLKPYTKAKNGKAETRKDFEKQFEETDSIIIFQMSQQCKVTRYGYAKNDEKDLTIIL